MPAYPSDLGEDEFLAREAETAKAAIGCLQKQILQDLRAAAQPTLWAEQYPLPSLGAALASGFAAAAVVKPMVVGSPQPIRELDGEARPRRKRSRSALLAATLLAPLIEMAKTTLKSAIIGAVSAKAAQASAEPGKPAAPVVASSTTRSQSAAMAAEAAG